MSEFVIKFYAHFNEKRSTMFVTKFYTPYREIGRHIFVPISIHLSTKKYWMCLISADVLTDVQADALTDVLPNYALTTSTF